MAHFKNSKHKPVYTMLPFTHTRISDKQNTIRYSALRKLYFKIRGSIFNRIKNKYIFKKKAVFWDVTPCRYCVNRRRGGTYRLHLQGRRFSRISLPTLLDSIDRASPEIGTSSIDWVQQSTFCLKTETESSLRNVVFWKINRTVL
jgi:hypothetical protein